MSSLYHPYLPDSVAEIATLIESKIAVYRGLGTNNFLTYIEECT